MAAPPLPCQARWFVAEPAAFLRGNYMKMLSSYSLRSPRAM